MTFRFYLSVRKPMGHKIGDAAITGVRRHDKWAVVLFWPPEV